ncbi:MAG: ETC complex I subunit [Proteobacteria bacterium]|nr:ETC complex I subunit [Pseudomonadota bacterium]
MDVRIYRPAKTAMQSGEANTRKWVLEFEPSSPKTTDPLMGWIGSADTNGQVHMRFSTRAAAVAFAKKHGFEYRVFEPKEQPRRPKSYASNFRYRKVE